VGFHEKAGLCQTIIHRLLGVAFTLKDPRLIAPLPFALF
jgi:hypothetical protein